MKRSANALRCVIAGMQGEHQVAQNSSTTTLPFKLFQSVAVPDGACSSLPSLISGESTDESVQPNPQVTDFGAWFSGLLAEAPSAYARIAEHLKEVMPDFKDIKNPLIGKDSRSLVVQFATDNATMITHSIRCDFVRRTSAASANGSTMVIKITVRCGKPYG